MTTTIEYTFRDEASARAARRQLINEGARVSLIAFDGSRDVYAFDLYRMCEIELP